MEAQEDGIGILVSCGPALWRKLRAEDGPEARDPGQISCLPCLLGKDKVSAPRLYGWEGVLLGRSPLLPSRFLEFFLPSGLLRGLSQKRTISIVLLTEDLPGFQGGPAGLQGGGGSVQKAVPVGM